MNPSGASSPPPPDPIGRVLGPIRVPLRAAALLSAVAAILVLVPLAVLAHVAATLLDPSLLAAQAGRGLGAPITLAVASLVAGLALAVVAEMLAHLADNRMTGQLRQAVAQRLMRVPLGWFDRKSSGEVKQILQDDIATLHALSAHFYPSAGRAAGAVAGAVLYLAAMDWRLALIALLPFPGYLLFLRRALRAGGASMPDFAASLGRLNSATIAFVNGLPVIKTFTADGGAHRGYSAAVDGFADAFTDFTRPLVAAMAQAHALIAPVTVLAVAVAGGAGLVHYGQMRPVEVLPFVLVAPGISAPLLLLHTLLHDLEASRAAAGRLLQLLETPLLEAPPDYAGQRPSGHEIRFENVGFGYAGDHPVLSGIDLTLAPGTVTAVVGASGAGKSTLARLLLRFHDPEQGRITLGGVDLRDIPSPELYRSIGFVLQEVRLLRASVRDNIALGRASATQEQIEQAARLASLHERILALPRGYDSVLDEDVQLSGGERQRLSIARAMLLDPPVLVLDEPTAAADAGNEVAIQEALSHFVRGRTVMVIAHRLETIVHADRIVVLDRGILVEQGTHAQLLARGGRYARLWASGGHARASAAMEDRPC
ncbi:ABC transporter ATP-binding protein [Stenotrophomonas mori]|uniref:ABC transporter ATP-binding protein/permease n=1 Tax=Stenotrophomonas mori TaxID=2871096 RepID=A0ABT0SES4_9GAMM|nr:ABC transporter ATP-binding protein [Stenotrophomonas mori]MCL7713823.1 ABC transporter ATP-binding protein/permease [Stenotrophomonas mori]